MLRRERDNEQARELGTPPPPPGNRLLPLLNFGDNICLIRRFGGSRFALLDRSRARFPLEIPRSVNLQSLKKPPAAMKQSEFSSAERGTTNARAVETVLDESVRTAPRQPADMERTRKDFPLRNCGLFRRVSE